MRRTRLRGFAGYAETLRGLAGCLQCTPGHNLAMALCTAPELLLTGWLARGFPNFAVKYFDIQGALKTIKHLKGLSFFLRKLKAKSLTMPKS